MSKLGKDPIPGRKGPVARWVYESPGCGKTICGFKAADAIGVYVHYLNKKSLPCRRLMSDGKLACALCAADNAQWRGYSAWYGPQYQRFFLLLTEDYREFWTEIEVYSQVAFSRAKNPICPVVPKLENWRTTPLPASADRPREVDISVFLLTVIFKDIELAEHVLHSDIPLSVPSPAVPESVARRSATLVTPTQEIEVTRKTPAGGEGGGRDGRMVSPGEMFSPAPSPNGKHRKKTE